MSGFSNRIDAKSIGNLRESYDFEAKLAQGRDGRGSVPKSFWETYSAMANSGGGIVALGVREHLNATMEIVGIIDEEKLIDDLWNALNDSHQISRNLLSEGNIEVLEEGGHKVVVVYIPRADRGQRPIYVGKNPLDGTFKRNNKGDYKCREEEVKRMIADAVSDSRDSNIIPNFNLDDIDSRSLDFFRNDFSATRPLHPWLSLSNIELLKRLGGWKKDRQNGEEGLTLAGLLIFGKWEMILEAIPHFQLDYQDQTDIQRGQRWVDRVVPDGTWAGNLYEFYRKVYLKITSDIKIPFQVVAGQRKDETAIHEAIREALINSLVHADYNVSGGTSIYKRGSSLVFKNPGNLRLPIEQIIKGGVSDCRNPHL